MKCDPTTSRDALAPGILGTVPSSLLNQLLLDEEIKMLVNSWIIRVVASRVLEVTRLPWG